ncbi:hypothetical protein Tco_0618018 [Tanacetum coccineum]
MINQGVNAALAARDSTRNGTDSHSSGTGVRGSERVARESLDMVDTHVMSVLIDVAYSMTWVESEEEDD